MQQYDFILRNYETDKNGELRLLSFFNLLQQVAGMNAEEIGTGKSFAEEKGVFWVAVKYHAKIMQLPTSESNISIKTWISAQGLMTVIREFVLSVGDTVCAVVASEWALLNKENLRPVKIKDYFSADKIMSDTVMKDKFSQIVAGENSCFAKTFEIRYDDIDVNQHVNNSVYPLWASESVPAEFRAIHTVQEIEVRFKKPACSGKVVVHTEIENNVTIHTITDDRQNSVYAIVKIIWK